jgi:hypothetical protein
MFQEDAQALAQAEKASEITSGDYEATITGVTIQKPVTPKVLDRSSSPTRSPKVSSKVANTPSTSLSHRKQRVSVRHSTAMSATSVLPMVALTKTISSV